jgi:CheY-like chemotaxis protein
MLLDLMMPVMGGEQVLQHLHHEGWLDHLPVVVLSGSPFLPPGAREYLRKPVAVERLLGVVRTYCGT